VNEKNLIPFDERTESEQREIARQGGIASGKARREKQQTRQILSELLSIQNKDFAVFQKLAKKLGLQGDLSIHEVFTTICLLNSVKSGNLGDLERLSKLLGEDKQNENADVLSKLDKVIGEVDKLAK
jgi:hypothetical protein